MIRLKKPDMHRWAKKNKKHITLLMQIAFLAFLAMLVALSFIGSVRTAEAEMDKWTYIALKPRIKHPVASQPVPDPKTGVKITPRVAGKGSEEMKTLIRRISSEMGYSKPEWAIAIATCESGLRPDAKGDGGKSWGMWQIHQGYHPTVGQKAFDPEWSTRWSIERLKQGRDAMWTCARILS